MVCDMDAAEHVTSCDTTVAPTVPALNEDLFVERTAKLGADSDVARARVLGVDRNDIIRWRKGRMPRLEKAMRVAELLDTTVEDLFGPVAA